MDHNNLKTASTYINNLLLARGLLRNGTPIDFTSLAKAPSLPSDDQENRPPGKQKSKKEAKAADANATTTAHVLNLVHDLILRRDRDQTHLESLSATLSTLRIDASHHAQELERANSKAKEAQRQVSLHDTAARNATNAAKCAEASARKLRDEVQRVKAVLQQVRAQHDKDTRKRDIEYHKLKQLVQSQQRGANPGPPAKSSADAYTIVDGKFGQNHRVKLPHDMLDKLDPADPDYALKSEGKEFLAELSKGLSDENDALLALIGGTLGTLRELMGMEHNQPAGLKTFDSSETNEAADSLMLAPPMTCAQLEKGLNTVLTSIRDLLTNPSFAPIEEVHVREEEIQRLREGWVMMEERWREAVEMMQGWRKKMSGGHNIEMEELRMGLKLGEGVHLFASSPARPFGPMLGELSSGSLDDGDDSFAVDRLPDDEDESELPDDPLLRDLGDLTIAPDAQADIESDQAKTEMVGTRRGNSHRDPPRRIKFPAAKTALESREAVNTTPTPANTASSRPKTKADAPGFMRPTNAATNRQGAKIAPKPKAIIKKAPADLAAPRTSRRIETQEQTARAPSPVLTIRQKLKLAEEEARRASMSPSFRANSPLSPPSSPLELNAVPPELEDAEQQDEQIKVWERSPVRHINMRGLPRRRKSTLSPEELEELLMGASTETETF